MSFFVLTDGICFGFDDLTRNMGLFGGAVRRADNPGPTSLIGAVQAWDPFMFCFGIQPSVGKT